MIKAILTDFNYTLFEPTSEKANSFGGFDLNQGLFDFFKEMKDRGIKIYVLTAGIIASSPEVKAILSPVITDYYFTHRLGLTKADPSLYPHILDIIDSQPQETVFVDDTPANVEAAKQVGINTVLYRNLSQATFEIRNIVG